MYNSTAHDAQREQHWASQRAAWNLVPQNRGGPGTSAETQARLCSRQAGHTALHGCLACTVEMAVFLKALQDKCAWVLSTTRCKTRAERLNSLQLKTWKINWNSRIAF